jgi:pimeloyl-ACP methyl ester carboxylesterase
VTELAVGPTHTTAETRLVEAAASPALTDALAAVREVILVDYPGVGSSTGEPCRTIAGTARRMIAFVTEVGLDRIELLGFSIDGFVAQELALVRPTLVRRLVLAATGPKGAPGRHGCREDIAAAGRGESSPQNLRYIMFAHTETSQAKGSEFLGRFMQRREGRDVPTSDAAGDAQYDAIVGWGIPDHAALQRLTGIQSPTLIIQGDTDLMIPTKLSHLMAGLIPDRRSGSIPTPDGASCSSARPRWRRTWARSWRVTKGGLDREPCSEAGEVGVRDAQRAGRRGCALRRDRGPSDEPSRPRARP